MGDTSWWVMWAFGCFVPVHIWSLFSYIGLESSALAGTVQAGALLAYVIGSVEILRSGREGRPWRLALVFLGYPVIVFGTNLLFGM